MTAPTVAVTVRLADFGGLAVAGVKVTAKPSAVDFTADGTFVSTEPVTATTDASGLAVLNVFPNAVTPTGLGTVGTTIRFTASMPGSRGLKVEAVIPNTACNLVDHVVDQEPNGLGASELAVVQAQAFRDLSQAWATKTDAEVVTGQGFGAKKYALDAASSASSTAGNAVATAADRVATAGDRVATAADRVATGGDRVQTGLDRAATAASVTAAQAARDTALALARRYVDTATAIADATLVNGSFFSTPSTVTGEAAIIYLKSGGVATESSRVPNAAVVQALLDRFSDASVSGYAWTVVDALGRVALGVADDGSLRGMDAAFGTVTTPTINGSDISPLGPAMIAVGVNVPTGYAWAVNDAIGRTAIGVKNDGTAKASALEVDTLNGARAADLAALVVPPASGFAADIVHVSSYGQSLSRGTKSVPVLSTTQPYDSLKFSGGVRTDETPGAPYSSLVPLIETQATAGDGTLLGETPCAGAAHAVKQLIASENGISFAQQSYQLLMSADGEGSKTVAALSLGTIYFTRLVASIQAGFNLAQAASKSYKFGAILWTQGEDDYNAGTSGPLYRQRLHALRSDAQTAAQGITGQTDPVNLISYQTATHKVFGGNAYPTIALAQLDASKESDYVCIASPSYHLTYQASDNAHWTNDSSKKMGFHYGLAYKRTLVDGKKWKPLMPISKFKQGAIAYVKFNVPKGKLVFDTTLVAANTNMGFNLFKSDGTEITLTSVTITGPDTVRIVASAAIPAGAKLQYAFYGTGLSGPLTGPRGNLRDSQGDTIVFDPTGLNYPAHNWCVMFEEVF